MLTRERIEEAVKDAVCRGRVTSDDAQDLVTGLVDRGRKQTNDVLGDLEKLLGRSQNQIEEARKRARKRGERAAKRARKQVEDATTKARKEAVKPADPVLAQADKARRAAGLGPSFPITGYDDLTVAQVSRRLADLSPAELRKVRDYERRHANRKTVLDGGRGEARSGLGRGRDLGPCPTHRQQRVRPRKGDDVEVTIDSLAHGGAGVGRAEPASSSSSAARCRATGCGPEIDKAKRSFAEARLAEVLEPSPDRIEPRAAHPGAPWQVLPYERQLAEKQRPGGRRAHTASAASRTRRSRTSCPPSSSGATATRSSTPSARRTTAS